MGRICDLLQETVFTPTFAAVVKLSFSLVKSVFCRKAQVHVPINLHDFLNRVNPGSWQVYYQFMFNGLPLETGKRLIISCVRDILQNTEGADPVDRPSAMVSEFFSISKKWPTVTTEPTPSEQGARKKRG